MLCPVCKKGEIREPKEKVDVYRKAAKVLRKEGFSVREIQKLLNYKSPNSVQHLLK